MKKRLTWTKRLRRAESDFIRRRPLEPTRTVWKTVPVLILASRSPIRQALIAGAGIAVEAVTADVNERRIEADAVADNAAQPDQVALRLAEAKAMAVPGAAVVGADQVLELDGSIVHKPRTMTEAAARLDVLAGRTHLLHSGVALSVAGALVWSAVVTSSLTMRAFSRAERDAYLAAEGTAALTTAGAYCIEGPALRLFERIEGDYFAIVGLPLLPLVAALRRHAPGTLEGFT